MPAHGESCHSERGGALGLDGSRPFDAALVFPRQNTLYSIARLIDRHVDRLAGTGTVCVCMQALLITCRHACVYVSMCTRTF